MSAIHNWAYQTQLQFAPRRTEKDYVEFVISDGNASNLGKVGGRQYIYLYPNEYLHEYAMHEISHAVGMIYEHQNFSRDIYIGVHLNNIIGDYHDQFTKDGFGSYGQSIHAHPLYDRGYPFSSLMMYASYNSFAIDPSQPTMTVKDPALTVSNPFVTGNTWVNQQRYLTASDRAALAYFYGYSYDPATDTTLTDEIKGITPP
jgi:Astacin (Peptidase family M12A).